MKKALISLLLLAGCGSEQPSVVADDSKVANDSSMMPAAVSNNAVALVADGDAYRIYSFLGLLSGKTWKDVTDRAFEYDGSSKAWSEIAPVPDRIGRLAATAITVAGKIYLFGGYTVAEDHTEVSTPEVFEFDPADQSYTLKAPMPVPVDDTLSASYRDRYIYLVSGWHDNDNVDDVQLYDTQTDSWVAVTDYPGRPLFGQAGGIAGDRLIVCGGVKVVPLPEEGKREFKISRACYAGDIDPVDPARIAWREIPHHPGPALYRAASVGVGNQVIFAGGSDNPYNYNGIGYDKIPSEPSSKIWIYNAENNTWTDGGDLEQPTMDHRGLLILPDGRFATAGGMTSSQQSLKSLNTIEVRLE